MTLSAIATAASLRHLDVFGAFHTVEDDGLGEGTLVLLGPREPGFWGHVTASPEFSDGAPDPLDRWSSQVISGLANDLAAEPFFPFGTPPRPFIGWALRSGRAWSSPVGLLVHDQAGLMVSFRGALLVPDMLDLPAPVAMPCETCDKPCLSACPVDALSGSGYALDACHGFLDDPEGQDCMNRGCAVRRSCPVSQSYARSEAQSAYHMTQFHKG